MESRGREIYSIVTKIVAMATGQFSRVFESDRKNVHYICISINAKHSLEMGPGHGGQAYMGLGQHYAKFHKLRKCAFVCKHHPAFIMLNCCYVIEENIAHFT